MGGQIGRVIGDRITGYRLAGGFTLRRVKNPPKEEGIVIIYVSFPPLLVFSGLAVMKKLLE
jgi:hypothetical protein